VSPGLAADAVGVSPGTSQCLLDLSPNPALGLSRVLPTA
jgi:hypothetical protein